MLVRMPGASKCNLSCTFRSSPPDTADGRGAVSALIVWVEGVHAQ